MSLDQSRTIATQQRTIRNLHVVTERQRIAIGNALEMLRAGYIQQAIADLERGMGAKNDRRTA